MDGALQALCTEQWSNGACLGYVIKAMENLHFEPDEIRDVAAEMRSLFDWHTLAEADKIYCSSPY